MKVDSGRDIPAIHVYYHSLLDDFSPFNLLLYGIEEEGIPAELQRKPEGAALDLGYQAALDSSLGVGIGIGVDNQIILHYTKLAKNRPLFQITCNETTKQRTLGANAARLVKGIPFKPFEENDEEIDQLDEVKLSKEEIALIVELVVKKLNARREGGN